MEDWALQGLSSFTKLQTQLAAKAAAANMDMRLADLEAGTRGVQLYKAAPGERAEGTGPQGVPIHTTATSTAATR